MQEAVIVVPCYNEEQRLDGEAFLRFSEQVPNVRWLFVNDGSVDNTRSLLDDLCRRAPSHLSVLHLPRNAGKANAVRAGLVSAFASEPAIVGYLDADLATPLSELPGMLAAFDNPNIYGVFGARVALLGRHIERSTTRHYAGRLFGTVASRMLGLSIYDTQCGAKLFRAIPEVRAVFCEPFTVGWVFDVEILARLKAQAKKGLLPPLESGLMEFPLTYWRDVAGSKLRGRDFLRAGAELGKVWWTYR